ncbi:MAG: hypothetical protein ABI609_00145 [Acidobacteriota bacterium]
MDRARRIGLFLLTAALGVVVAEGGARVALHRLLPVAEASTRREAIRQGILPQLVPTFATAMTAGLAEHPFVGFVMDPSQNRGMHGLGVNELGFIDSASPLRHRSPDSFVLGITGGSVAFWLSRTGEPTLRAALAAAPSLRGRRIELVRLALGGFRQPQQTMTIEYLLTLGAEFDEVVNLDGFNEVALYRMDAKGNGSFPTYPRGWSALSGGPLSSPSVREPLAEAIVWRAWRRTWAARMAPGLGGHTGLGNLVWLAGDRWLEGKAVTAESIAQEVDFKTLPYSATGPITHFESRRALAAELATLWESSSRQLSRTCLANGIRYVHVLQPNQYVPGSKPMSRSERALALADEGAFGEAVREGYSLLAEGGRRLASEAIDFHDLTRLFQSRPEPLYIDSCCHLNEEGNRLLGEAVGSFVVASLERNPLH